MTDFYNRRGTMFSVRAVSGIVILLWHVQGMSFFVRRFSMYRIVVHLYYIMNVTVQYAAQCGQYDFMFICEQRSKQ